MSIHSSTVASIDPVALYKILMLRTEVFIHEQGITAEPEIDGLDLEPTTTLFWLEEAGVVQATLRVLNRPPHAHVGRVATAAAARGRGLAGLLMAAVLDRFTGEIEISARAYLEGWYGKFGFVRTGENYVEAGLDHLPMTRPAS